MFVMRYIFVWYLNHGNAKIIEINLEQTNGGVHSHTLFVGI